VDIHQDPVPLRTDEGGAIRVGKTRVLFELVVDAFQQGATPEEIAHEIYTTLEPADVYAVIAYYLRHKEEVDLHLRQWEEEAGHLRRKIEAAQGPSRVTREILQARRKALEQKRAAAGQ
jgi:uncharacterized protein (DUF433 family)